MILLEGVIALKGWLRPQRHRLRKKEMSHNNNNNSRFDFAFHVWSFVTKFLNAMTMIDDTLTVEATQHESLIKNFNIIFCHG